MVLQEVTHQVVAGLHSCVQTSECGAHVSCGAGVGFSKRLLVRTEALEVACHGGPILDAEVRYVLHQCQTLLRRHLHVR